MKKALRFALRASVVAATLAFSNAAMAENPTVVTSTPVLTGTTGGFFGNDNGSAVLWNLDVGSDAFLVFCIDSNTTLDANANSYVASVFTPSDSVKRLYETFYPSIADDSSDASFNGAFQLALWELNNDDANLATGALQFSQSAAANEITLNAQAMLTFALGATPLTNAYAYTRWTSVNPPSQGLLSVSPVPEPSSWAMLLAGLGIAGAALRRQRRA